MEVFKNLFPNLLIGDGLRFLFNDFQGQLVGFGACLLYTSRYRKHSLDGCGSAVAIDGGFFALGALAEVVIFRPGAQVLVFQSSQLFLRLFQLGLNFLQLFAGNLAALFLFLLGLSGLRFGGFGIVLRLLSRLFFDIPVSYTHLQLPGKFP